MKKEDYRIRLLALLKKDAFQEKEVILSSGKRSDFYIDCRRVTLSPEGAYLVARLIFMYLDIKNIDAVAGPTLGADPIIGAMAGLSYPHKEYSKLRFFIVRSAPKSYGTKRAIEGPSIDKGMNVAIVEDVVTTGRSLFRTIDILEEAGAKIRQIICIVDREEGAREELVRRNLSLLSIFHLADFFRPVCVRTRTGR